MDINIGSLDFDVLRLVEEDGTWVEHKLKEELTINEDNLMVEMLHQPSKYIYWSSVLEKLKYFQESVELELERVVASLDNEAREHIKSMGEKPTKDSVDSYIKRTDKYKAAKDKEIYYKYIVGRVQRIVKAFEQRKDMLQSYGKQIAENKVYGQGAGTRIENSSSLVK